MKQVPILSTLIVVLVLITASTAGAVSNAAVLYLRVAAGARPAGMGEAFVSIADDATATYWNPAGLGNAPVAGQLETESLTADRNDISDVVTMNSYNGKVETWAISGDQLVKYDGKTWNTGQDYMTSSDQTLADFLQTILSVTDEEKLDLIARRVVSANCSVDEEEIDNFSEQIRAYLPADYPESEEVERGLDTIKAGYNVGLLNAERFKSLLDKLKDGMKDSVLTAEEMDKITYSLDQAVLRFLPSRLIVPYSATITGKMACLSSTGNYLWAGTDDGLYRHSGISWARYTTEHGLPSNNILVMDEEDEHLLIGTDAGMGEYYHGAFKTFPDLPKAPVTAISFASPGLGYAVADGVLYRYDGNNWYDSFSYTVRLDDSIDKIVERIAVYHTDSEYEYLTRKIMALNAANKPVLPEAVKTAEEESLEQAAADTVAIEETADEDDSEKTEEIAATDSILWLVEGNVIQLPYSPVFKYDATALFADDVFNTVWVGTSSGLLSFDGQVWTRHGYNRFVVPGPDTSGEAISMTALDIANNQFPLADSAQIAVLADNIDEYNELNGQSVSSGDVIFVYNHNTGASINSVGKVFGDLYVATEYSLEKSTSDGWTAVEIPGLEMQEFKDVYDFEGQAYYIAAKGLGVETKGRREFVVMFVKWLPTLDLDMYYGFISYVHNARGLGTFGISAVYLSYGNIDFTDASGNYIGQETPFEFSLALSYGTSVNKRLKLGGTVKTIHSHLSTIGAGQEKGSGIAWAFAVDAGLLFKITDRLQLGSAVTNLGPDISYIDAAQADPLPRNLGIGLSYRLWDTPYNSLVMQGELNKMLTNFDDGFGTEMENAIRHIGAEYWYSDFIAFRAGYKYDKEGQVKHLTFGAGLQYGTARFDMAYVPSSVDSPLANTLRISFSMML